MNNSFHNNVLPVAAGPFRRLVVSGESTVAGGGWLDAIEQRWADVLAGLLGQVQDRPPEYINDGRGANVLAPGSAGYASSSKPSMTERYAETVIARRPDLWVVAYGLNDSRAGTPVDYFIAELARITREVQEQCGCVVVLCTVYYMTQWRWYPPFDLATPASAAAYNEAIRRLAAESGALCADVAAAMGGADWLVHNDGIHANTAGNLVIAHEVFRTLLTHCPPMLDAMHERHVETEWTQEAKAIRGTAVEPSDKLKL